MRHSSEELRAKAQRLLAEADQLDQDPPPPLVCSKCGVTEDESDIGFLMEIRVITNPSEEGCDDVTMRLCNEDLQKVLEGLAEMGFRSHAHGGTAFLQDDECPGAKYLPNHHLRPCATPTDPYEGTYIVGNWELSPGRIKDEDDE